jgi:hypothetical protein
MQVYVADGQMITSVAYGINYGYVSNVQCQCIIMVLSAYRHGCMTCSPLNVGNDGSRSESAYSSNSPHYICYNLHVSVSDVILTFLFFFCPPDPLCSIYLLFVPFSYVI